MPFCRLDRSEKEDNEIKYPFQIYRSNAAPFIWEFRNVSAICYGLKYFNNDQLQLSHLTTLGLLTQNFETRYPWNLSSFNVLSLLEAARFHFFFVFEANSCYPKTYWVSTLVQAFPATQNHVANSEKISKLLSCFADVTLCKSWATFRFFRPSANFCRPPREQWLNMQSTCLCSRTCVHCSLCVKFWPETCWKLKF